jgi:transcriptional regulator with PAS, ATPase and Fis domain
MTTSAAREAFSFDGLIGRSPCLTKAIETARMIARARLSTVMLVGETGTGKELFARGIHCEGSNAAAPFVAVNCAAIPDSLLESELFGHEAGAFTGARARKIGLMELAGCGTLFLDELHHLPTPLQPKLLRALEDRRIRRLGGSQEIGIECRVIAATNISIEAAVEADQFREDLFYRLNVLRVDIPPLRTRGADIELLAQRFLDEVAREHGWSAKVLLPDALVALRQHGWPGNVRELKNVIERAAVVSGAARGIDASHLLIQQRATRNGMSRRSTLSNGIEIPPEGKTLAQIECEAVQKTLELTRGNQSRAARILGISRPTLARILRDALSATVDYGAIENAS